MGRSYALFTDDDGANYREIAEVMTALGFPMNHSSVHNHVLRSMMKFLEAFMEEWGVEYSEDEARAIIRNPEFQGGVADLLHLIEAIRREER
jgi:hypothetical protein